MISVFKISLAARVMDCKGQKKYGGQLGGCCKSPYKKLGDGLGSRAGQAGTLSDVDEF